MAAAGPDAVKSWCIVGVQLPFAFDTSDIVVKIGRAFLAVLCVVVLPGIAYSLFVSHQIAAVASLAIIGAIIVFLGRLILANMRAWKGTITAREVIVEPTRLAGLRLGGPEGRFSMERFRAVRIESVLTPPTHASGRSHARVSLVGRAGTPTILIARAALEEGRTLGRELAESLALPVEDVVGMY
jgi:hypothetical protein